VVAVRDIAARVPLEAADVTVRQVPMDDSNASGTFSDPTTVIGLIPSVPILTGQPVLANMLAGQSGGGTIGILAPNETIAPDSPAWRAVAITVPEDRAAGGLIEAGQTVDMIATVNIVLPERLEEAGRYASDRSTKLIYQDMLVLAKTTTAYVVKAPINVAEEISHFQASGQASFTLLIRPSQDLRMVDAGALGTTTSDIIQRYGLPLPEVYPAGLGPLPRPSATASASPRATATPGADESASPAP
jgi:Flp pilus assembly protein CpaB